MEKEKILEIEIKKINNEYSAFYPIKMDIDKLTEISDGKSLGDGEYTPYIELRISGYCYEIYLTCTEIFPQVIKNNCIEELKKRIDEINEKYGIPKRWKPKLEESFFIVERVRTEVSFKWIVTDLVYKNDHWIDFYAINSENCFKTYEEAEKVVLKLEELEKNFWAKVRAGEIGGDE